MKKMLIFTLLVCLSVIMAADATKEIRAIKKWLSEEFDISQLEAERSAKLAEFLSIQQGEFESTAKFLQRKEFADKRIAAINADYEHKIRDLRSLYEAKAVKMRQALIALLGKTRETITMYGQLGTYDPDRQTFPVTTSARTFDILVPEIAGPLVKYNFVLYELKVTRQLDEDLKWNYLEARLEGPEGKFSSTDKAPDIATNLSLDALVPPKLSCHVDFTDPGGDKVLDAEETAELKLTVSNEGEGSAYMVEALIDLGKVVGIVSPSSVYIGQIKPGESVAVTVDLAAGLDVQNALVNLRISFKEQNGFPPDDVELTLNTQALLPPDIFVYDTGIKDSTGNDKIEPGETVEVTVRVFNRGIGPAKNVKAKVLFGGDYYPFGNYPLIHDLGDMAPGEYRDFEFGMAIAKTATELDLRIDLTEEYGRFDKKGQPLGLALNRLERTADQVIIAGKKITPTIENAPLLSLAEEFSYPDSLEQIKNRWGVIIGIEQYSKLSSADFADNDAQHMHDYFTKVLGIPTGQIYSLRQDKATFSQFKYVFDPAQGYLARNANQPENEIFIYFSGHGAPDFQNNEAYLLPYDADPNSPALTGYSIRNLYENLGQLQAGVTVFLDSCFSGSDRNQESILAGAKYGMSSADLPSDLPGNLTVFVASGGAQVANVYPEKGASIMNYYIRKGTLEHEADYNKDHKITRKELESYLQDKVSSTARLYGREQDPKLYTNNNNEVIYRY